MNTIFTAKRKDREDINQLKIICFAFFVSLR